jgi:hypothetical protein
VSCWCLAFLRAVHDVCICVGSRYRMWVLTWNELNAKVIFCARLGKRALVLDPDAGHRLALSLSGRGVGSDRAANDDREQHKLPTRGGEFLRCLPRVLAAHILLCLLSA